VLPHVERDAAVTSPLQAQESRIRPASHDWPAERIQPPDARVRAVTRFFGLPLALVTVVLAGMVVLAAVVIWWFRPYTSPRTYLPALERNSAPLIAAIDRYIADRFRPPEELHELVPRYIAAIPGSGYRGQPEFNYFVHEYPDQGWQWNLYVFCEPFDIFEPDEMCFESWSRRWKHSADR
jgi:hypothetical protein